MGGQIRELITACLMSLGHNNLILNITEYYDHKTTDSDPLTLNPDPNQGHISAMVCFEGGCPGRVKCPVTFFFSRLVFINTYQVCWSMHRFIRRRSSHVSSRFRGRPRASFTPTSGLSRGRIPLPPPSKSYYISVGTVRARTRAPGFRLRQSASLQNSPRRK